MTTATLTKTKTIWVELSLPVRLELEVTDTDTETILTAVLEDFNNPESNNTWDPEYQDVKALTYSLEVAEPMDQDLDCFYLS